MQIKEDFITINYNGLSFARGGGQGQESHFGQVFSEGSPVRPSRERLRQNEEAVILFQVLELS